MDFHAIPLWHLLRITLILFIGLPIVWFIARWIQKTIESRVSSHIAMLISNLVFYSGLSIIVFSLIQEFGFNISALLGAAGVVGIAIGFAAKTTFSNIISGIFLLIEHPFVVGDRIMCSGVTGFVQSIDLMSVKLRTLNGQFVRIPNETLIANVVTNISFYPKRRLIFRAEVPSTVDLKEIMSFLSMLINEDGIILKEPAPIVAVRSYPQYSIEIMLRFWTKKQDAAVMYYRLQEKIDTYAREHTVWIALQQEV